MSVVLKDSSAGRRVCFHEIGLRKVFTIGVTMVAEPSLSAKPVLCLTVAKMIT